MQASSPRRAYASLSHLCFAPPLFAPPTPLPHPGSTAWSVGDAPAPVPRRASLASEGSVGRRSPSPAPSPPLFVRPPHVHNGMRRKSASLSPPRVGGGAGLVSGARAPSLVVAVVGPSGTRATTVCGLVYSVCCAALCALLVGSVRGSVCCPECVCGIPTPQWESGVARERGGGCVSRRCATAPALLC